MWALAICLGLRCWVSVGVAAVFRTPKEEDETVLSSDSDESAASHAEEVRPEIETVEPKDRAKAQESSQEIHLVKPKKKFNSGTVLGEIRRRQARKNAYSIMIKRDPLIPAGKQHRRREMQKFHLELLKLPSVQKLIATRGEDDAASLK